MKVKVTDLKPGDQIKINDNGFVYTVDRLSQHYIHASRPGYQCTIAMDDQELIDKVNEQKVKTWLIKANGLCMDSGKFAVPECKIEAFEFADAVQILNDFLKSGGTVNADKIQLITPIHKILFE